MSTLMRFISFANSFCPVFPNLLACDLSKSSACYPLSQFVNLFFLSNFSKTGWLETHCKQVARLCAQVTKHAASVLEKILSAHIILLQRGQMLCLVCMSLITIISGSSELGLQWRCSCKTCSLHLMSQTTADVLQGFRYFGVSVCVYMCMF